MPLKQMLIRLLLILSVLSLTSLTLAQDEHSEAIDLIAAALDKADDYTSFAARSAFSFDLEWSIPQFNLGTAQTYSLEVESEYHSLGESLNATHHLTEDSESRSSSGALQNQSALKADVRFVDGTIYVSASNAGGEGALPPEWIVYDESSALLFPGMAAIRPEWLRPVPRFSALYFDSGDLTELIAETVSESSVEEVLFEDGSTGTHITLLLSKEAARDLDLLFDMNDPVQRTLYFALEDDILHVDILLNAEGDLLEMTYTVQMTLEEVDISAAVNAPGTTIDVEQQVTYSLEITQVNQPIARVEAPETVFALTSLPAYGYTAPGESLPWWNDRVFYEVFVRSFYDSDGDGIGDIAGLTEKLDYLNDGDPETTDDLGITGLWLMPMAQSPSYHGYDVTDYYTIEEDYGTREEFEAFIQAARLRGITVIVDLVLNHTSSQHPWFIAASEGDPEYEDYYIWAEQPGDYMSPWGSNVWHRNGDRFYYGLFWEGMPDLNYENPEVTEEMRRVIAFWLDDMGVDGFRLDAIRHLIEDGAIQENTPATLAWLEDFYTYVDSLNPNALTVGEIWDTTAEVVPYVGTRVDIAFEFDFATAILTSLQTGRSAPLIGAYNTVLTQYPAGQYATFLTNHDQNRVMTQLEGNEGAAQVGATLLLTNPGVPFIYYGEEIGASGEKPDERIRTPMQWDDTPRTGGFTTGRPWQSLNPFFRGVNVAMQTDDPNSLLSHYRRLIHLRNSEPALRSEAVQLVDVGNPHLYSYLRYDDEGALLVIVNLSGESVSEYKLRTEAGVLNGDFAPELLLGEGELAPLAVNDAGGLDGYVPLESLEPYGSWVIRVK